jgi:rhomboid protease GluP
METRRMCPHCRAFITNRDRVCPYCNEPVGERAIDRRAPGDLLGGLIPHSHFATTMLLVVNASMYLAMSLYNSNFMDFDFRTLYLFGAKFREFILMGQWWRLVTAGFLHGGLFHIAMNSWVLYDLGAQIDEVYGTSRFVIIYFVSTIGGFAASTYWSDAPSVGASAGLCGFIGAMIALGMRSNTSMGAAIRGTYIRWAIYIFLFGLLPYFRVDNAAHLGGLAAGFGTAYITGTPRLTNSSTEQAWRIAAWVCGAITLYCFWRMYLNFSNPPF